VLTTTVDGLWVLQAVTGIEMLCPELGLRPLVPKLETADYALRHPMADSLKAAGALDDAGEVDPIIREWLTVILRRDLTLLVNVNVAGQEPVKAAVCRFAHWWVVLERNGDLVRLSAAGQSNDESSAQQVIVGQVERLCGVNEAAPLRPITLDGNKMLEAVTDSASLRRFLLTQGLDADQLRMMNLLGDPATSTAATIVGIQAGIGDDEHARLKVGESTVTIADTEAGRVCVESVEDRGRRFQMVSSGTRTEVGAAVCRLIRKLPAGVDWHSWRRVV